MGSLDTMSRRELDKIQTELKIAIQTHQIIVSKMQLHPQDMSLKSQLHGLQKEILSMSQKQKSAVEKLRQHLLEGELKKQSELKADVKPEKCHVAVVHDEKLCEAVEPKTTPSPLRVPQYPSNRPDQNTPPNARGTSPEGKPSIKKRKQSSTNPATERARELKQKMDFMACFNLVPPDSLKENSYKRSERKRKSTNNPNFAYGLELERRPRLSTFLASDYFGAKKTVKAQSLPVSPESSSSAESDSSLPSTPVKPLPYNTSSQPVTNNKASNDSLNGNGEKVGQLVVCHMCNLEYCAPPLPATTTDTPWTCSKCQETTDKSAKSLAAVNAYITLKQSKEEEKRKVIKRSSELLQEKTQLETRTKQLNEILAKQNIRKEELLEINQKARKSMENLKKFISFVQAL